MRNEPKRPPPKRPYRQPQVKSQPILVPDLFLVTPLPPPPRPDDCAPFDDPRPECA
jgi:hypothetical protein